MFSPKMFPCAEFCLAFLSLLLVNTKKVLKMEGES